MPFNLGGKQIHRQVMRKPEIAISLSGGGYRAAMYHLGALMYLYHLSLDDNERFLDYVNTISTISGGSITGLWYMMQYAHDNISEESFKQLYYKLCNEDLMEHSVDALLKSGRDSLIMEMVDSYDRVFFDNEKFSLILDAIDKGHIHHFSANGTDFSTGYGYRFQATGRQDGDTRRKSCGVIGNGTNSIPADMARGIKLSEIMAVSSCFTGGFEPINFPTDFEFYRKADNKDELIAKVGRYQLMDGGVVDNQGIEPLILANQQMVTPEGKSNSEGLYPCHDLMIVSDVSSPDVDNKPKFEYEKLKHLSLRKIDSCLNAAAIVLLALTVAAGLLGCKVTLGIGASLTALVLAVRVGSAVLKKFASKAIKDAAPVEVDTEALWSYPLQSALTLVVSRLLSFYHMSDSIFMKSIRQLRYTAVYGNPIWNNRKITNAIYELSSESKKWEPKVKNGRIPEWLAPSAKIQAVSKTASEMGTTLWFTKDHWDREVPQSLLACGQYNICMNLIEYIYSLKRSTANTNESHELIMKYEDKLRADWEKFQENPMWMVPPKK